MDRREAVKSVAILIGGTLSATTLATLFDSCNQPGKNAKNLFSANQGKMLAEIADIILPPTAMSPGAKEAGVGPFISMMIQDCYPEDAQKVFIKGLDDLEETSKKQFQKSFLEIDTKQREQLLRKLREQTIAEQKPDQEKLNAAQKALEKTASDAKKPFNPVRQKAKPIFFAIARDLTLLGFFSSEIGATKALNYVAIPGKYDGDYPIKPGQRAWA